MTRSFAIITLALLAIVVRTFAAPVINTDTPDTQSQTPDGAPANAPVFKQTAATSPHTIRTAGSIVERFLNDRNRQQHRRSDPDESEAISIDPNVGPLITTSFGPILGHVPG